MTDNVTQSQYLFSPPQIPAVEINGDEKLFPVNRIFCIGRNYAAHAKEMGMEVDREAPFFFTKPANAITASGSTIAYPPGTKNFHYEMELVLALGANAFRVSEQDALQHIYGYACGLDLTRRDLQLFAREKGYPWDLSKAFEQSAVVAPIVPVSQGGHIDSGRIYLTVNDEIRQDSDIAELIWSVPELLAHLSHFYHLQAGDLIFTGTPAGVGPLHSGDRVRGGIDGLVDVTLQICDPE